MAPGAPARRDRVAFLKAHRRALRASAGRDGALVLWPPRLSDFPPPRERTARPCREVPILERDLKPGVTHRGRVLHLRTVSEPSVNANTVTAVAEDDAGAALHLVLHHYAGSHSQRAHVAAQLPQGTRLLVRDPYFEEFRVGGAAVCCAQPDNLVVLDVLACSSAPAQPTLQVLLDEGLFAEALHAADVQLEKNNDVQTKLQRVDALIGLKRYRDAVQALSALQMKEKMRDVLQLVKEGEWGDYDLLSLHIGDAVGPTRFSCATFVSPRVAIRNAGVKGKGVFALEPLSAGELIMGSKAEVIIFNSDLVGKAVCRAPGWDEGGVDGTADTILMQHLAKGVLRDADRRRALLELSRGRHEAETSDDEAALLRLLQVVEVNRFSAFGPWEGPLVGTGLWIAPSRFNHACDASCTWYNVGDMLFVRCQRSVAVGEELTIAYCNPTDSLPLRQEFLRSRHGFTCSCKLCTEQSSGCIGAARYERDVNAAESFEEAGKMNLEASLQYRIAAFEFLQCPKYCSLRHTQVEHAIAAYLSCQKLGRAEDAVKWLQCAQRSFTLQWGEHPGVFDMFLCSRGIVT